LRFFRKDARGNVAVLAALTMPIMLIFVGVAIDLNRVEKARGELQDAADAAALSAVAEATVSIYDDHGASAIQRAKSQFDANLGAGRGLSNIRRDVSITPSVNGSQASVTFSADVEMTISALFKPSMTVSGTSLAENSVAKFVNFYLAVDISQSMGIGATQADMNALMAKTPDKCAFGCHMVTTVGIPSYWQIARNNNILLRIDSLRDATQQLIDTAVTKTVVPNQFKVGVYSLHKGLATVVRPSSDLVAVRKAASNIDLGTVTYSGDAQSAFDVTLPALSALIPAPGDGKTAGTAKGFVFIITDGIQDQFYAARHPHDYVSGTRFQAPLDPALCDSMKRRGLYVAVLYTEYIPIPTNSYYNNTVKPFISYVEPSLRSCATGGFFYKATTDAEIHSQLQSMFLTALQTVRISS
jgi:Flp pilus assembly protein TadG